MTIAGNEAMKPYADQEVPVVLRELVESPTFAKIVRYVWPERELEEVKNSVRQCNSVEDFQKNIMFHVVHRILSVSSDGLSYSGINQLDTNTPYLFVANHRDIVLDSSLLQIILVENGFETSEVTFGDNLIQRGLMSHLFRLNKMHTVKREGSRKELYEVSLNLSNFVRNCVSKENRSVWIAQGSGRTKDGNDLTQTGLLKMLNMTGESEVAVNFEQLNIVPLAISYEYEPCDAMKAREICTLEKTGTYQKQEGEDFNSIIKGLTEPKGRIHLGFGQPLSENLLAQLSEKAGNDNEYMKLLALEIDRQITSNYKLWPNNFAAAQLLNRKTLDCPFGEKELVKATDWLESRRIAENLDGETYQKFLEIYANPLF